MDTAGLLQVGELSTPSHERLIRSHKNPLDKCTIVSIFPQEIDEVKHTIEPGKFHIDAGTYESPSILIVGSSSWWKKIDSAQPSTEIQTGSIQVAEAIVKDYCNGLLEYSDDSMPGLFYAMGEHKVVDIKLKFKGDLDKAKIRQDNWYRKLVRMADALWARTNGNPLTIANEMRLAAKSLNFNDKPWLRDYVIAEQVRCVACGSLRNPSYPICAICKAIDPSHPMSKELKFA